MDKFVGIIGKIGPAFSEGRSRSGEILISEPEIDSVWSMPIPGAYFSPDSKEQLRAAFDHLLACE